jgi:uncharacterized protein Yka (UPF0111/DUF47 family)
MAGIMARGSFTVPKPILHPPFKQEFRVRFRLIPRDTAFYDYFAAAAENIVEGTKLLDRLVRADIADRPALADQLRQVEHAGDEIVHDTLRRLNTTFVTPFDRADIYALTSALDDCIDQVEEGAALIAARPSCSPPRPSSR